ncbi:MAG TPA: hypothetical protein VK115_08930 [Staphylococcus sp.]|nr:hypothetical protein [Staphylococcus sp.]
MTKIKGNTHFINDIVVLDKNNNTLISEEDFIGLGTTLVLEDAMYLAKMLRDNDYADAFYYFEYDRKARAEKVLKV